MKRKTTNISEFPHNTFLCIEDTKFNTYIKNHIFYQERQGELHILCLLSNGEKREKNCNEQTNFLVVILPI